MANTDSKTIDRRIASRRNRYFRRCLAPTGPTRALL